MNKRHPLSGGCLSYFCCFAAVQPLQDAQFPEQPVSGVQCPQCLQSPPTQKPCPAFHCLTRYRTIQHTMTSRIPATTHVPTATASLN